MVLIGLSILIASLSFLCYKHPPSSWPSCSFMTWLQDVPSKQEDKQEKEIRAELDRKTMPPPPPPITRASSDLSASARPIATKTPKADSASARPGLMVNHDPTSSPLPSFPALGSIQRASGGRGPPRLNPLPVSEPPLRSINTLLPPPSRSPLPNRSRVAQNSTLTLPPTHTAIPPKPRLKVQLTPGHSPLDWAHLSSSLDANLRGLPPSTPYLRVPTSLLRQHTGRKDKDAWTVLGGKVYNITPYLPYHPGGVPELMKAAGRDGTKLFGEIHPWVNWEGMLESCLVGVFVGEDSKSHTSLEDID